MLTGQTQHMDVRRRCGDYTITASWVAAADIGAVTCREAALTFTSDPSLDELVTALRKKGCLPKHLRKNRLLLIETDHAQLIIVRTTGKCLGTLYY